MDDFLNEMKNIDLKVEKIRDGIDSIVKEESNFYNLIFEENEKDVALKNILNNFSYNAHYRLGTLYLLGIGVEQNTDLAEKYLLEVYNNNAVFSTNLAVLYYLPKYNKYNLKNVCKYLELPLKVKYFRDAVLYYKLCEQVNDNYYNPKLACSFLKDKLKLNKGAAFYYAVCMKRGIINDENENVEELLEGAVNNNVPGAILEYVDTLKQNMSEENNKKIIELLEKSNDVKSMYELASMYLKDKYLDVDKAISLYEKCAKNSYPIAMLELGKIYSNKKYNRVDIQKAKEYLEMAVKNGIVMAEIELMKLNKK